MAVPGGARAHALAACLLCVPVCTAQQSATVSVCMDDEHASVLSQFPPDSDPYQMLLQKYKMDLGDGLGINHNDITVLVPPDCDPEPALPPPPPPIISRPGLPTPPPPPPPPSPQTLAQNMVIDISPEYAAAVCRTGSTAQNQMILRFQELTAARLSTCTSMRRGTIDHDYKNIDCHGCAPGTCLATDSIQIDPTMFGCEGRQDQVVEHEMELTVSDTWARTLCQGEGSPEYDETVAQIQQSVADSLSLSDPSQVTVDQLRSTLDCDHADHNDNNFQENNVFLDVTDEYAHQLCDKNSGAFQQFKIAFQRQVAASLNNACDPASLPPGSSCPREGEPGYITPEQVQVDDDSILNNAHCTDMANGMEMPAASDAGPAGKDVDAAAAQGAAGNDSSAFDLAVIVLLVACVGMGYRYKTRPPQAKYQAVSADEEIPLSDYSIDSPSDSDRDRRDNPSFAGQFGAARIGSGKRR